MSERTFARSRSHLDRARQVIPRGVSSAKRAALRPTPLAFVRAAGSRITDVDGNEYVDYVAGYGPMLLGHQPASVLEAVREQLAAGVLYGGQHEAEAELAERIVRLVPSAERVLLSVTGSEAVQAALRVARAATGRRAIVKFEGHYHGWLDPVTANGPGSPAGSGPTPRPVVVPDHSVVGPEVLVCPWNDTQALADLLARHGTETAAVIMEPVAVNGGNLFAQEGYLAEARRLCDQYGCLLVFDEVVTGFRLALGGAQQRLNVVPDLTVLAKALGSGFPISAVAGRAEVMRVAEGPVAHSGTYNGNALSVVAANATLDVLETKQDTVYPLLERLSGELWRASTSVPTGTEHRCAPSAPARSSGCTGTRPTRCAATPMCSPAVASHCATWPRAWSATAFTPGRAGCGTSRRRTPMRTCPAPWPLSIAH
ncbi:aspartate aminotransferase family protein [Streptomyces scopuliridis]|uniref:aspartate aminotransferase family protein n=1 Tax=Streptomyces scopuliridis TaxID=452529 RepID=UPI0036B8F5C4